MKLYTVLVLVAFVSAATALKCYVCTTNDNCQKTDCPANTDRCSTAVTDNVRVKSCLPSSLCVKPIECCSGDLCNGAIPTGSSILLLLLSSAIMTVFL